MTGVVLSGIRSGNEDHLIPAFCFLPTGGEFELAGLLTLTAVYDKMSPPTGKEGTSNFKKVNEQRGNVYENKGPGLSSSRESGNIAENKGSYAVKRGMSLKIKVVSTW